MTRKILVLGGGGDIIEAWAGRKISQVAVFSQGEIGCTKPSTREGES